MSFDVDFERDIITLAATDPKFRRNVRRALRGADPWTAPAHRIVWGVVAKLGEKDELTPKLIVKKISEIDDDDEAEAVAKFSKRVFKGKVSAPHYALEELRDFVRADQIKRTLGDVVRDMKAGDVPEAEKRIAQLARSTNRIVQDESGDWFDGWEDRQAKRLEEKLNPDLRPRIKTRFKRLDKRLNGGLAPEQVGLILAHTGVGKSLQAMSNAFFAAAAKVPTVYVSTEMSKELVDTRLDSRFFARPSSDFAQHKFSKHDLEEFEAKRDRLRKRLSGNLLTVATPINTLTKSMLAGYLDDMEQQHGKKVGLLVVDCADHMVPEYTIREKRLQQVQVYWDLKELISTRQIACWATVHASGDRKALLTEFDTAESKDKSKIADIVISLNQTRKERMDDKVRLYIAKNRTGEKGAIIDLKANYAHSTFEESTEREEEHE